MGFEQLQTVVVALGAVLVCVYALSLVAKRMRGQLGPKSGDCVILSSTFVGPKERLLLVSVRDKELLIGVGPSHMCRLGEFPKTDHIDQGQSPDRLAGQAASDPVQDPRVDTASGDAPLAMGH